jgi:hypothetical protein
MAKIIIIIEDTPSGQVAVNAMRQLQPGEDLYAESSAAKAARYVELKLIELFAAGAADRSEEAARCWH